MESVERRIAEFVRGRRGAYCVKCLAFLLECFELQVWAAVLHLGRVRGFGYHEQCSRCRARSDSTVILGLPSARGAA